MSNYRNPNDGYNRNVPPNNSQMYNNQGMNPNVQQYNQPRGFSSNNQFSGMPQQQMQHGPRGGQYPPVQQGFQQNQQPRSQFQQPLNQQQQPRPLQPQQQNPGEWEQFFSQNSNSQPGLNQPRGFPRAGMNQPYQPGPLDGGPRNLIPQQQQQQFQNSQPVDDRGFRGPNPSMQKPQQSHYSADGFAPRGPRGMPNPGRGQMGPRGPQGFDQNSMQQNQFQGHNFNNAGARGLPMNNERFQGNQGGFSDQPYNNSSNNSRGGYGGNQFDGYSNSRGEPPVQQVQPQGQWQQDNFSMGNSQNTSFPRKTQGFDNNQTYNANMPPSNVNQISPFGNDSIASNRSKWQNNQFESSQGFNQGMGQGNQNQYGTDRNLNSDYNSQMSRPHQQDHSNNFGMSTSMKIMQTVGSKYARGGIGGGPSAAITSGPNSAPIGNFGPSHIEARPIRKFPPKDSSFIGRKRSRSKSPVRSRSNSNERPIRGGRKIGRFARESSPAGRSITKKPILRSPPRATPRPAPAPSPAVQGGAAASSVTHKDKGFDIGTLTPREMIEEYQLPAVQKNHQSLSILELNMKFPKLYIPADFTDLRIDWTSISFSSVYDFFFNVSSSAPIVFENTPATLVSLPTSNEDGQNERKTSSDILESAKYTYVSSNVVNNILIDHPLYLDRFINTEKPVKFNVKVLVCCGLKDPENERIDHNYTKKLRVLCGRKKGNILLLGTSWCAELDGGDPRQDRSCLLNTARRALLAQSLIDIAKGTPDLNLVKLCEVCYHRPREEIKGRVYPEQEEISAIYVYSIQRNIVDHYSSEDMEDQWTLFNARVKGQFVGPMLSRPVNEFEETFAEFKSQYQSESNEKSTIVTPSSISPEKEKTSDDVSVTAENNADNKDTVSKNHEKPSVPSVFICPMPLPNEISPDSLKKQDGLSLRMMPLNTVLSYSPDDCNERIFEASIAAEMFRSCISMNFANIIVDFLICAGSSLTTLADFRIAAVVKRLKELNVATRAKLTPTKAENDHGEVKAEGEDANKEGDVKVSEEVTHSELPSTLSEEPQSEEKTNGELPYSPEEYIVEQVQENSLLLSEGTETQNQEEPQSENQLQQQHSLTTEGNEGDQSYPEAKESTEYVLTDEEARIWRRRFIGACRWFDTKSERYLRADFLQVVFQVSQRNLSRADVVAVIEEACGDSDRLRYETFV